MAAVAQVHTQKFVAGVEHRGEDGGVGLRAGVGLDVGVFGIEEQFGAVDGDELDFVDVLATAIPAFAGVTLGVLVGEHAALGLHDGRVGEVFGGDELDVALLTGKPGF